MTTRRAEPCAIGDTVMHLTTNEQGEVIAIRDRDQTLGIHWQGAMAWPQWYKPASLAVTAYAPMAERAQASPSPVSDSALMPTLVVDAAPVSAPPSTPIAADIPQRYTQIAFVTDHDAVKRVIDAMRTLQAPYVLRQLPPANRTLPAPAIIAGLLPAPAVEMTIAETGRRIKLAAEHISLKKVLDPNYRYYACMDEAAMLSRARTETNETTTLTIVGKRTSVFILGVRTGFALEAAA